MTDREKAIVMAYTGVVMLSGDKLNIYYQYVREKLGKCVMTHELAYPEVQDAIADAAKNDFIELAKGNDVPTVCEWVSVKDRLPKHGKRYLIYATSGDNKIGYITTASFGGHFVLSGRRAYWKVTHWMPLPEPPVEDKQ